MSKSVEKKCPECGQKLRVPEDIGGILMECPSCGERIYTDFRLDVGKRKKITLKTAPKDKNFFLQIFELPTTITSYLRRLLLP